MAITSVDIERLKEVKKYAAEQDTTIKAVVNDAVDAYLDDE